MIRKRVYSGIRATGRLHLGNYFGAVKGMLELQDKYDCIFAVVDLCSSFFVLFTASFGGIVKYFVGFPFLVFTNPFFSNDSRTS